MNPNFDFSILIVNWNQSLQTSSFVKSIRASGVLEPIIIFDNHSKSKHILEELKQADEVTIQYSEQNYGYGKAINIAYTTHQLSKYPFLLLVNHDIVFNKEVLDHLLKGIKSRSQIAVVGPLLQEQFFKEKKLYAGGKNIAKNLNTRIPYDNEIHTAEWIDVDYIPGTFFLVRTSCIGEPFLNDDYFFGGEVAEYCHNLNMDFKACINTSCIIEHVNNKLDPTVQSHLKAYYNIRNRFIFIKRHGTTLDHIYWVGQAIRMSVGSLFRLNFRLAKIYFTALTHGLRGTYGNANSIILRDK